MAKVLGKKKKWKKKKTRGGQTVKRVRRPEDRHYPSFWEKSALQLVSIVLVIGLLTWGYQMDFHLFPSASAPGVSLRGLLDWESMIRYVRHGGVEAYLNLFLALIKIGMLLFVLVIVINFWVQWTWHELKPFLGKSSPSQHAEADQKVGGA